MFIKRFYIRKVEIQKLEFENAISWSAGEFGLL